MPSCLLYASQPAPWDSQHLSFPTLCYVVLTLGTSISHFSPAGGRTLLVSSSKAEEECHESTCPLLVTRKGSPNLEDIFFSKGAPASLCGQFVLFHPVQLFASSSPTVTCRVFGSLPPNIPQPPAFKPFTLSCLMVVGEPALQ